MPARKDPPPIDDDRTPRSREPADDAGGRDDSDAFDRAVEKVVTPEQNGFRTGTAEEPKAN